MGLQAERVVGRAALKAVPDAYAGKIPARVRRLSPAKLAAYELPMGLLGFPGLGWLFGGFPFQATILLCGGPALAWAVLPIAFTPYGEGPLRSIGWKIELAYLPVSALLSAVLLYRAHRKRRLRSLGEASPRRPRRGGYRTRVSVAAGSILLVLVSLPLVPAVAGLGSGSVRYTLQSRLTKEVTGQFLVTPRGPVKLFAWQDPQASYPDDALRVRARDARALLVRASALDAPSAYRLYDADTSRPVPLGVRSRGGRSLSLAPLSPLRPGRYVFAATHEGMFGGRDYAYMTIVPPNAAVSKLAPAGAGRHRWPRHCRRSPQRWSQRCSPCCSRAPTGAGRRRRRASGRQASSSSRSPPRVRQWRSGTAGHPRSSAPTTSAAACSRLRCSAPGRRCCS